MPSRPSPSAGLGAGGFEDWWARHATVPLFVRNPHSLPLQQAAELGVAGLSAASRLPGRPRDGWRFARLRAGLARATWASCVAVVAAGAIGAAVDWTWEIPAVFGPVVDLRRPPARVGAAPALCARRRLLARRRHGRGGLGRDGRGRTGGAHPDRARQEPRARRPPTESARRSTGPEQPTPSTPWSAEPLIQLALLESETGNFAQALATCEAGRAAVIPRIGGCP